MVAAEQGTAPARPSNTVLGADTRRGRELARRKGTLAGEVRNRARTWMSVRSSMASDDLAAILSDDACALLDANLTLKGGPLSANVSETAAPQKITEQGEQGFETTWTWQR